MSILELDQHFSWQHTHFFTPGARHIVFSPCRFFPKMATDVIKPPPKRKKPLCDLIFKKLVKSAVHPKAKFLPSGILDELITYDSVIETLSTECDLPDATEVASWVCHAKAQKLFAIAVRARLSGSDLLDGMRQLREKGMTDNNLPVTEAFWRKNGLWLLDDDSETAASSIANADDSSRDGKFIWTHTALEDFLQKQWEFLCPVFSTAVFNRNLESDCVLPFTKKLPQSSNGAFGQVTGYKIHPSHLIGPAVEVGLLWNQKGLLYDANHSFITERTEFRMP